MAKFAVGQNHTGQKRAQCGRKPHKVHQKGDAHHDDQGQGRVHFRQVGGVDKPEHGPGQIDPRQDHNRYRPKRDKRHTPSRQSIDQRQAVMGVRFGHAARQRPIRVGPQQQRHRQQRHQRQHRDHRDILRQQHRKGRPPALGLDQPL